MDVNTILYVTQLNSILTFIGTAVMEFVQGHASPTFIRDLGRAAQGVAIMQPPREGQRLHAEAQRVVDDWIQLVALTHNGPPDAIRTTMIQTTLDQHQAVLDGLDRMLHAAEHR